MFMDSLERDSQAVVLHLGHDPDVDKHPGPQPERFFDELVAVYDRALIVAR
jgi:hypothetical protein